MNEPDPLPTLTQADKDVLAFFAEHTFAPVEVRADDLVSLQMTSRFEVARVTIDPHALRTGGHAALEHAVRTAVNLAIRKVAEANARRLGEVADDPNAGW